MGFHATPETQTKDSQGLEASGRARGREDVIGGLWPLGKRELAQKQGRIAQAPKDALLRHTPGPAGGPLAAWDWGTDLVAMRLQDGPSDLCAHTLAQSLPRWLGAGLWDKAVWRNTGLTASTPTSRTSPAEDSQALEQPCGEAHVGELSPRTGSQHQLAAM